MPLQTKRAEQTETYLHYWGKAGDGGAYHPLAWHSLDVAAVSAERLRRDPFLLREIASASGLSPESVRASVPFLLALHDVGKFAEGFQDLRPEGLVPRRIFHKVRAGFVDLAIEADAARAAELASAWKPFSSGMP